MQAPRIACIGAGQMASALVSGWVTKRLYAAADVVASDPDPEARRRFAQLIPGTRVEPTSCEAVRQAKIVLLATKPSQLQQVAQEIRAALAADTLLVSVAAGVTLARLAAWFGTERIIRVMPNTPCLVGQGASAFALGPRATEADAEMVQQMMGAVGVAFRLDESLLDAVTGLSGSGPAYVYQLIEALSDGGVRVGLPRAVASALAAQTVRGAAEMVLVQGEHPAVLKDRVASPGGTTIAGLQALEEHGFRSAAMAAVVAATRRASELGREQA
ncbi:MAG: pyrroline-5-carboxylate reductase [Pirellulaceae bacterium]